MKAAVKTAWVKDLREHPEVQGTSALDYIDPKDGKRKQCCLGRLCLLAVEAGAIPAPELQGSVYTYLDDEDSEDELSCRSFCQDSVLPRAVQEWAGLDSSDPVIDPVSDEHECDTNAAEANDTYLYSFPEIADLVEKNVPADA